MSSQNNIAAKHVNKKDLMLKHFKLHRGGNFQNFNARCSAQSAEMMGMMQVEKWITPFHFVPLLWSIQWRFYFWRSMVDNLVKDKFIMDIIRIGDTLYIIFEILWTYIITVWKTVDKKTEIYAHTGSVCGEIMLHQVIMRPDRNIMWVKELLVMDKTKGVLIKIKAKDKKYVAKSKKEISVGTKEKVIEKVVVLLQKRTRYKKLW
eukprot:448906_1